MPKPVGGRGHKAPYATVTVRIPEPIRLQVEYLAEKYREKIDEEEVLEKNSDFESAIKTCNKFIQERNLADKLLEPKRYVRGQWLAEYLKWLQEKCASDK